jgi:hypothetical protein
MATLGDCRPSGRRLLRKVTASLARVKAEVSDRDMISDLSPVICLWKEGKIGCEGGVGWAVLMLRSWLVCGFIGSLLEGRCYPLLFELY